MEVGKTIPTLGVHGKELEDSKELPLRKEEEGLCSICLVKLELPEPVSLDESSQYLSSYLKTDLNQLYQKKGRQSHLIGIQANSKLKVVLCTECEAVNQKCSELSGKLEEVQEGLSSCLKIVQEKVTKAEDGFDGKVPRQKMKVLVEPKNLIVSTDPLKNQVILAHLFDLCPLDILTNARLVCKQWRDVSLTTWRSRLPLTFRLLSNKIHVGNRFTPLDDFLEFLHDPFNECEKKPFRSLHLADWKFTSNIEKLQVFWKELRLGVTSLELHGCTFPNVGAFRKIIFKCYPNLQRLALIMCTFRPPPIPLPLGLEDATKYKEPIHGEHKHLRHLRVFVENHNEACFHPYKCKLPISWLELLSHFQSLTSLELITRDIVEADRRDEWHRFSTAFKIMKEHDPSKLRLKNFLYLPPPKIFPSNERLLRDLRLPLDSAFIMLENRDNGQYVKTILETYANTLGQAGIFRDSDIPLHWRSIPLEAPLENLVYFHLKCVLADNMEFLEYMPKLNALEITDSVYQREEGPFNYSRVKNMISNSWKLESELPTFKLENLTYFVCSYIVTEDDLTCLIKWMPNVKKLEMVLDDGQFRLVCQNWNELEGLKVMGDMLTDEGVTGIRSNGENTKRPNITFLQSLSYFCFWSRRLTDVSVLQGFVKLPNLGQLQPCAEPMRLGRDAAYALSVKCITVLGARDTVIEDEDGKFHYE